LAAFVEIVNVMGFCQEWDVIGFKQLKGEKVRKGMTGKLWDMVAGRRD